MTASQLIEQLSDLKVELWEERGELHFQAPTGVLSDEMKKDLSKVKGEIIEILRKTDINITDRIEHDSGGRYAPYSLSDIQSAYLIGRDKGFEIGNVSCHAYYELESENLDIQALELALNKLIGRHDVLRLVFEKKREQRVLEEVPHYSINTIDLSTYDAGEGEHLKKRKEISHKIHEAGKWPLFEVGVYEFKNEKRLYISFDLLLADFSSAWILYCDLLKLYKDPDSYLKPLEITFRDCQLRDENLKNTKAYRKAKEYWMDRLESFPSSPMFPLKKEPVKVEKPFFKRKESFLDKDLWQNLKKKAALLQITPSVLLVSIYSQVLAKWSREPEFAINMTLFNRQPVHDQIMEIAGDFTAVSLLEIKTDGKKSFIDNGRVIQKQLWDDMDNRLFTGVNFIREISRARGAEGKSLMPVVFSSMIGIENADEGTDLSALGTLSYGITQTPQVYLDHQVMEHKEGLYFVWDYVEEIFYDGMIDDMFFAYEKALKELATDDDIWKIPSSKLIRHKKAIMHEKINEYEYDDLLHTLFEEKALLYPDNEAVVTTNKRLSYKKLKDISDRIASLLLNEGVKPGDNIAVIMEKGWEQVAGTLGILKSGCVYLPIDPETPEDRLDLLMETADIRYVLTQSFIKDSLPLSDSIKTFDVDKTDDYEISEDYKFKPIQSPDDTAYIIFTSGSTGVPKGVVISHRGAVNTIKDINERFSLSENDRVIALSALNFDLSVYDIFGTLSKGAAIIMPEPDKTNDPAHWADVVKKEKVTFWNSVPQLMQMFTEHLKGLNKDPGSPLKAIMMSGDWIPVGLPEKIRSHFSSAKIYSLGGATEASIWSICYPIEETEGLSGIPYGKALKNQKMTVLDRNLDECPVLVTGQIFIGGAGLATEYLNDEDKTEKSFIFHPETGERLYKTGDLGRFLPDGNIEFLGREDFQVKINGYRIELGEIESVIRSHPFVKEAVTDIYKSGGKDGIAAYLTADLGENSTLSRIVENDGLWNELIEYKELYNSDLADNPPYSVFQDFMDGKSIDLIIDIFSKLELFHMENQSSTFDYIVNKGSIKSGYHTLIKNWLDILTEKGLLSFDGTFYTNKDALTSLKLPPAYESTKFQKEKDGLNKYISTLSPYLLPLLKGEEKPLKIFYSDSNRLSPEDVLNFMPGSCEILKKAKELLLLLSQQSDQDNPLKILEIGAQKGDGAELFIKELPAGSTKYTVSDLSQFFTAKTDERFRDYPFVNSAVLDIEKDPTVQGFEKHSFDAVIAVNSLHRSENIGKALDNIRKLLKPSGVFLLIEGVENSIFQKVSIRFIQEDFTAYTDEREELNLPLIPADKWKEIISSKGFVDFIFPFKDVREKLGHDLIIARAPSHSLVFESKDLTRFLSTKLTKNMMPSRYICLDSIPLTANGKVDRKALPSPVEEKKEVNLSEKPRDSFEGKVSKIWEKALGRKNIGIFENFFESGGDSLIAVEFINEFFVVFNIEVSLPELFTSPTIAGMAEIIRNFSQDDKVEVKTESMPEIVPDPDNYFEPFPLTDVQQAYWVGRSNAFELGNVSTHTYFEIENDNLDAERLSNAFKKVIKRHHMLRAVILPDGRQKILEEIPEYKLPVYDLRGENEDKVKIHLHNIRAELEHQIIELDKWPLFDIRISMFGEDKIRIHLSLDALILDGWSMVVIFRDWKKYYLEPDAEIDDLGLSYRDYVLADLKFRQSSLFLKDQEYALSRIDDIPPSPKLPLAKKPGEVEKPFFSRLHKTIDRKIWQRIKEKATRNNLTPSGVLVAAFAKVLGKWSENEDFTINLTFFNRLPIHPEVGDIVGDFTTLKLLPVHNKGVEVFSEYAGKIQKGLWKELDHKYFNGVNYIREISKRGYDKRAAVMPVVFTSFLGIGLNDNEETKGLGSLGKIGYNVSQTPQVYLDNQVGEREGNLSVSWDVVEELFPENLLTDMFDAYVSLIETLGREEEWRTINPELLPEYQKENRKNYNSTDGDISPDLLHTLFIKRVVDSESNTAIISKNRTFSYKELYEFSNYLGYKLRDEGVSPGKLVAVHMEKGWEQIAGVLSIFIAGGAYLPVSDDTPKERLFHLLKDGEVEIVLTTSSLHGKIEYPEGLNIIDVDTISDDFSRVTPLSLVQKPSDLAYVIYTSGSTGLPKGVMTDHRGAVNTIKDLKERFSINENDKVLALSNLSFDLSVFDIFTAFSAGGAIVIPENDLRKDPAHWIELINKNSISIWNSAPMFMQMLMEYSSSRDDISLESLRLVMMSGDWIPVNLPDKIRKICRNSEIISLGGATEASVWSILYPVEEIKPCWKSIPYGKPMKNQKMYVLGKDMKECPQWVPGSIYIGGIGLAKGYWKDSEKTHSVFITHPLSGERLYKTGDKGRYLPDGNMEFLGREDFQLKINGFRVEPVEIENTVNADSGIENSVTLAVEDENGSKHLVSYIVPSENDSPLIIKESIDEDFVNKSIDSIVLKAKENFENLSETVTKEEFIKLKEEITGLSVQTIINTSSNMGILNSEGTLSIDSIIKEKNIKESYKGLIDNWLNLLSEHGYVKKEKDIVTVLKTPERSDFDASSLSERFSIIEKNLPAVLTGETNLLDLLLNEDSLFGPGNLTKVNPAESFFRKATIDVVKSIVGKLNTRDEVNLLEIGSRAGDITGDLISTVTEENVKYIFADESSYFLDKAKEKFGGCTNFSTAVYDMNKEPYALKDTGIDIIATYNTLHRSSNIDKTLAGLRSIMKPGGILVIMENTENSPVEFVTTGLFEGDRAYSDFRKDTGRPLISTDKWQELLKNAGFENILLFPETLSFDIGQNLIIAFNGTEIKKVNIFGIKDMLSAKFPPYMIPEYFVLLESMPVSANGKIDRKKLPGITDFNLQKTITDVENESPQTGTQIEMYRIWKEVLGKDFTGIRTSFFDLGGDSLLATRMINMIREKFEIEIALQAIFEKATIYQLSEEVDKIIEETEEIEEGSI